MVKTTFFVFVFLILQCGLVISTGLLFKNFPMKTEITRIPLSELVEEMRLESSSFLRQHVILMALFASYGDQLYEVSTNLSAECFRTCRATSFMIKKLAISEESINIMGNAVDAVVDRVRSTEKLEEHPLEVFCRTIEKDYAQNSNLSALFEKAKKEAANFEKVGHRPPYSQELIKSEDSLKLLTIDRLDVPEVASLFACASFMSYVEPTKYFPSRKDIFARTCQAVAKNEKFADSIQSLYEKTLNDTVAVIAANDRVQKFASPANDGATWWVPGMMKTFYGYIAQDPILKKEVDSVAASMFPYAWKEDLDFSKF